MTQLTALYLELLKKEKSHSHGEGADSLWLEVATMAPSRLGHSCGQCLGKGEPLHRTEVLAAN